MAYFSSDVPSSDVHQSPFRPVAYANNVSFMEHYIDRMQYPEIKDLSFKGLRLRLQG